MNECREMHESPTVHTFEVEDAEPTPRDRKCLCGEHTWGEMDDLLTLTEMWERS